MGKVLLVGLGGEGMRQEFRKLQGEKEDEGRTTVTTRTNEGGRSKENEGRRTNEGRRRKGGRRKKNEGRKNEGGRR